MQYSENGFTIFQYVFKRQSKKSEVKISTIIISEVAGPKLTKFLHNADR